MNSTHLLNSPDAELPSVLSALESEKQRRLTEDRLRFYRPYPKQAEFHAAGATYRERLLMAANQVGKTFAAAMELAAHVSGQYPSWWQGYRFDRAIRAWAAGETAEVVRTTIQLLLLGESGQHGTGCRQVLAPTLGLAARWPATNVGGCRRPSHASISRCQSRYDAREGNI